jgi:predicted metalloprotease with PDZ domain
MRPPVPEQLSKAIETLYRSESGRVLATLVRLLGDLDLAEEAMHEAFAAALESWPQPKLGARRTPTQNKMRSSFTPRRLARHSLAIVFAACAITFSVRWIFQMRYSTPQPGFTSYEYSTAARAMKVGKVLPGTPAELAGLRPADQIVAIDGRNLNNLRPFYEAIIVGRKEVVELTVEQPGSAAGQRLLRLVVRGERRVPERTMRLEDLLGFPLCFPLPPRWIERFRG